MTEKVYLDTNILIAHQIEGHQDFNKAKELIEALWHQKSELFISGLVVDEFLYGIGLFLRGRMGEKPFSSFTTTFRQLLVKIMSWKNVRLVSFSNSEKELSAVLELIRKYNLRPRDAFHLQIMSQNNVNKIATFDNDFQKAEKSGVIKIVSR